VISWDPFEGAVITHQFPPDLVIDSNTIQTIDITHQFQQESPWIVVEDKGIKVISYLNGQKAVALLLLPNEIPATFVKFLAQLSEFVLLVDDDKILQRLQESFSFIQAEIPVNEIVLLDFANQIEQLKEEILDTKNRIRTIIDQSGNLSTKILLYLAINDGSTLEKIEHDIGVHFEGPESVKSTLDELVDKGLARVSEINGTYHVG